jgi:hypothetical protein
MGLPWLRFVDLWCASWSSCLRSPVIQRLLLFPTPVNSRELVWSVLPQDRSHDSKAFVLEVGVKGMGFHGILSRGPCVCVCVCVCAHACVVCTCVCWGGSL